MPKSSYLIILVLFFCSILNSTANENDTIIAFKKNVDSILISLRTNPSNLKITKQLGGRKIKVKGMLNNGTKTFKQKIKYNGGFKKESIIIKYKRYKKNKLLLLKVVNINDQHFFIRKNNYKSLDLALKFSKETYVAEGIYKNVLYDGKKQKYKSFYFWKMLTPDERY